MLNTKLQSIQLLFLFFIISYSANSQCVSDPVSSLVKNGDFTNGNKSFTSGYTYCTSSNCLYPEGYYAVGKNANFYHNAFVGRDHTTGTGNFMIVNGAGVPSTIVWRQTISIKSNTDYNFSAWVMSLVGGSPAQLQFQINGTTIGSIFSAPSTVNLWQNFFVTWNSGSNTSAVITILNQNTTLSGNDFGLDDISFIEICNTPVPNLGTDQTLCGVGNITLDAKITHNTTTMVTWSDGTTGTGTSAPYTKVISSPGTYWVCVKDGPCVKTDTINITANFSIDLGPDFTLCAVSSFNLDAGYKNSTTSYKWYKNNTLIADSSNRTFLVRSPGLYRVDVFDASCNVTRSDEVQVNAVSAIPNDGIYCPPGAATFSVTPNPTGGFKWYDQLNGGSYLGKGNSLSLKGKTGTQTVYAEDTSAFVYNVGPKSKFGAGWASPATTDYIEFDAATSFTLDAVTVWAKVYNPNDAYTVGVKIYDNSGAVIGNKLVPVTGPPIVPVGNDWPFTVTLGIPIPQGTGYQITNEGSIGDLFWSAGAANTVDWANYNVNGVITLKGMGPSFNYCYGNCYGFFYNWQISKGNNCARVPVMATVNCPTPVQFVDLAAQHQDNSNVINWTTVNEKNVNYFIVEISSDGKKFESMGKVVAKNSNGSVNEYSYEDLNYHFSTIYYRIKEVDKDEIVSYSNVISLAHSQPSIHVFPNPTDGVFSVTYQSGMNQNEYQLTVHNPLGELIFQKKLDQNRLEESFDLNHYPVGLYVVTVKNDNQVFTEKVVKY